jgi:hypothetical protein
VRDLVLSSPEYLGLLKKYEELKSAHKTLEERQKLSSSNSECSLEGEELRRAKGKWSRDEDNCEELNAEEKYRKEGRDEVAILKKSEQENKKVL